MDGALPQSNVHRIEKPRNTKILNVIKIGKRQVFFPFFDFNYLLLKVFSLLLHHFYLLPPRHSFVCFVDFTVGYFSCRWQHFPFNIFHLPRSNSLTMFEILQAFFTYFSLLLVCVCMPVCVCVWVWNEWVAWLVAFLCRICIGAVAWAHIISWQWRMYVNVYCPCFESCSDCCWSYPWPCLRFDSDTHIREMQMYACLLNIMNNSG